MRALLALSLSLLTTCPSRGEAPAERRATVLITGDLWGYLEPCGCSKNMRGGLDRTAAYVAQARGEGPVLLVDAGDALFDRTRYAPSEEAQAREKARTVAAALSAMGLSAKAMFERDRVLAGAVFPPGVVLQGPEIRDAGGVKFGLLPVDATAGDAAAALQAGASSLRAQGARVVLALVHAPRPQVIELAASAAKAGVDLVVGTHIDAEADGEKARIAAAPVPVLFTQARGQSLLRLDFVLRGDGRPVLAEGQQARDAEIAAIDERILALDERIAHLPSGTPPDAFRAKVEELKVRRKALAEDRPKPPAKGSYVLARFVPITDDRPSDPAVRALVDAYDGRVAELNLAYAAEHGGNCPAPQPGQPAYVGGAACAACHRAAHDFWLTTRHAHAYETLVAKHKQHDLSCIGCHVTGWEKPGGACRIDQVDARVDVTCESCHGPGSLHLQKPVAATMPRAVPEATCRSCHTPENSLAFDYRSYLARILGPGHGAPLPARR